MARPPNTPPPWEPAIAFWEWPTMSHLRLKISEWYEERAAIVEFDAELERGEAEQQAYRMALGRWSS